MERIVELQQAGQKENLQQSPYMLRIRRGRRGVAAIRLDGGIARLIPCALIGFEEGPVCQAVVDGNDDRVFEKLGENHQEDHEEAAGGQVAPAHLRRMEKWVRTADPLQREDDDREGVYCSASKVHKRL